ncbi:MAG: HD domain-containing protein [Methanococcaceae archaeon]
MKNSFLAAIDAGTNSFHLIIAKLLETGGFEIVDREKEVIRLGVGEMEDSGNIQPEAASRAVTTLKRFKLIARSYNAPIRLVATSAVREALNKTEFIKQVFDETGIEMEVISGLEESRLIYLGILQAVPIFSRKVLCIDIGGGSTELIIGQEGRILYASSLKIGAVRLTQRFFPGYKLTKIALEKCASHVFNELLHTIKEIKKIGFDTCIGSSGTIMSAALMINALGNGSTSETTILNNFTFSVDDLEHISSRVLASNTQKSRKKIPGLDEKRADIIPAGIVILNTIARQLDLKEITVSGYALREGIVLDTLNKSKPAGLDNKLSDIKYQSILKLSEICNYDKEHSFHVAGLALQIFDQVSEKYSLGLNLRIYLESAAILHDIGYHIAHSRHHKHSHYIIRNSELMGFNENEIDIIANTARYHRKTGPKEAHKEFSKLNDKTKKTVKILSSILRVADSLDRTHAKLVNRVVLSQKSKRTKITVYSNGSYPEIELWSFERRKGLFEEVFNTKLLIEVDPGPEKPHTEKPDPAGQ